MGETVQGRKRRKQGMELKLKLELHAQNKL
jgi:hypothetical protein